MKLVCVHLYEATVLYIYFQFVYGQRFTNICLRTFYLSMPVTLHNKAFFVSSQAPPHAPCVCVRSPTCFVRPIPPWSQPPWFPDNRLSISIAYRAETTRKDSCLLGSVRSFLSLRCGMVGVIVNISTLFVYEAHLKRNGEIYWQLEFQLYFTRIWHSFV